jgi:hypothetical protein
MNLLLDSCLNFLWFIPRGLAAVAALLRAYQACLVHAISAKTGIQEKKLDSATGAE